MLHQVLREILEITGTNHTVEPMEKVFGTIKQ